MERGHIDDRGADMTISLILWVLGKWVMQREVHENGPVRLATFCEKYGENSDSVTRRDFLTR
jgi:hypothetical protein